ncbi:hypothetical protein FIA58_013945 [Flavobacterium jejuense]|uniref:Uncharacterized protein n=1 Tax=Flavobacterium jejuense TaxID=1544455 RepID=A0ABX0ISX1_9FLAO|nr:hypothetical protein [Flavobacterium jejuense]NHN26783.1 hypothetical protein [Flavobacterium jejuense]
MKIDLKLNNDTLIACNKLLQELYNNNIPVNEHGKLVKSIALDLADKIDTRCKKIVKQVSILDYKKQHKITFKYYEAWGLYQALKVLNNLNNNEYQKTLIQSVINILNQKLL